ncbi:MAG: hypothetical protein N2560_08060, partial [Ignavibacteria bacterium]|nr:hypothetical protein [Ignavibacteria bacterium]
MNYSLVSFVSAIPCKGLVRVVGFLLAVVFSLAPQLCRADLPVVGDWSDIIWWGGNSYIHRSMSFHPSSSYLAASLSFLEFTELVEIKDSIKVKKTYPGDMPTFTRSGKYLGYVCKVSVDEYEVRILDFEADTIVFRKKVRQILDYNPSFAITSDEEIVAVGWGNRIDLHRISTGEIVKSKTPLVPNPTGRPTSITYLKFIPNQKKIFFEFYVSFIDSKKSYIWDLESDKITETNWKAPIAISYDEKYLAYTGGAGRIATVIDLTTGEEVGFVPSHPKVQYIDDLALSPDRRY